MNEDLKHRIEMLAINLAQAGMPYQKAVRAFKIGYMRELLLRNEGNQCKVAAEMGVHRNTVGRIMAEIGLYPGQIRGELKRLRPTPPAGEQL